MKDKVTNILLQRILDTAEKSERLPWERPWQELISMNWYTGHQYSGINRFLLDGGEYITAGQMDKYNKANGTNYRFKKGIKWEFVLYVNEYKKQIKESELPEEIASKYKMVLSGGKLSDGKVNFLGYSGYYAYVCIPPNALYKVRKARGYHKVANIRYFADENGNEPVSKIESGEVIMNITEAETVIKSYRDSEAVRFQNMDASGAYYVPALDMINIPPKSLFSDTEAYYSTVFHEMAHSTGAFNRLNREGIVKLSRSGTIRYSKEELVAEMASCLLCSETGISQYTPQEQKNFESHISYVQGYLKYLKTMEDDIVYICSDAEKAMQYIMNTCTDDYKDSDAEC